MLIRGANDRATINGIRTGNVTEDGTLNAGGTLGVADIDDNTAFPIFRSVTATDLHGVYGDFTFNISTGVWGYTLRNADANVQALSATDDPTDVLRVTSQDGTASQAITVTVNGADEAATGGGGTTPPIDPVIFFDFGPEQLVKPTNEFPPIFNFTTNDRIHFSGGIIFDSSSLYDFIPDASNTPDSTLIRLYVPDPTSHNIVPYAAATIILVGFTQLNAGAMISTI